MAVSAKKTVKKLTRIGVKSAAVTLAVLYAIIGVVYALIYAGILTSVGALGAARGASIGLAAMGIIGLVLLVAVPVIFAIIGFIAGALTAYVYNFVVKYTGGIAFEVTG